MRTLATCTLLLLGTVLLAAGQYTIAEPLQVAAQVELRLGALGTVLTRLSPNLFPTGIALGMIAVLAGALLVALAIGQAPCERMLPLEPRPLFSRPRLRNWGLALLVLACPPAVLTVVLLLLEKAVAVAVVTWLATLGLGLSAAIVLDRARGTGIGNPVRHWWEWGIFAALIAFVFVLVGHDLTHWRWTGTPDEGYFFSLAKLMAQGSFRRSPLSPDGVFGFQPVLSSYYQAAFMWLFGMNAFGWKLSSVAALAVSLPLLYLAVRDLWGARAGFLAAIFFGSSQLAVGFSHFGYNNSQIYPVVTGALAAMAWCTRRRSLTGYGLTGLIAGLGFFTYYVALAAIPLAVLAGWGMRRLSMRRGRWREVVAFSAPILWCALPLFTSPTSPFARLRYLTLPGSERAAPFDLGQFLGTVFAWDGPTKRIAEHWLISIVHPLWFPGPHHFQSNPIVDPIAAALAGVGFCIGLRAIWRRTPDRFLVPGYIVCAFVAGAVTPHSRPPLTRLLVLSPLMAMLGAVALDQLLRFTAAITRQRALAWIMGAGLVLTSVWWNYATLHRSIYEANHGYGDGTTSELLRLGLQLPKSYKIIYIQKAETYMAGADVVFDQHEMADRFTHLRPFDERARSILSTLTPPVLVAYDLADPIQKAQVESSLQRRFPEGRWHSSHPNKGWNLRYFTVPDIVIALDGGS